MASTAVEGLDEGSVEDFTPLEQRSDSCDGDRDNRARTFSIEVAGHNLFMKKEGWSMEKEGCSMTDNRACSLGAVGVAFVTGGLLGAAAALLLAPQSGRQSQEQLRGYARRAEESVHELADEATDIVGEALDKGREFIKDKQAVLSEAVEAGRTAMHRERERPSAEKKA